MVRVDDAVSVDPSLETPAWLYRGNFLFSFILELMNHPTKNKGDLGVLKAQADLCEKGFLVCIPLSEHTPFDLVAYREGKFRRIQVKARSIRRGKLDVRFEHSYSDSRGVHTKRVDMDSIDIYCVYCLDTGTCYYFSAREFAKHTFVSLRVNTPKNNQSRHVRWADDYREVP
jgi:hypothetical protein